MEKNNTLAIDFFEQLNTKILMSPSSKKIDKKAMLNIKLQPYSIGKYYPKGNLNTTVLQLFSDSFVDSKIFFANNYGKMIDDALNGKVHFKFSPLINLDLLLQGKYEKDAQLMQNKLECSLNASHLQTCFSIVSNTLQQYGFGFCHLVKYYGGGRVIKKQFIYDVEDCIDILTQTEYFMNSVKKKKFVFVSNERIPSPLLFYDFSKKYSVENYDGEFDFDDFEDEINNNNFCKNDGSENVQVVNDEINNNNFCKNDGSENDQDDNDEVSNNNIYNNDEESDDKEDDDEKTGNETETDDEDWETDNETRDNEKTEQDDVSCSDNNDELWNFSISIDDEQQYEPLEIALENIPCEVIAQEQLTDTLENFIKNSPEFQQNPDDVGASILLQIVAILIAYHKAFHFVHNDLHTDNIMFIKTDKTHIYYIIDGKTYCVPTYGYIFKIIDFGRCCFEYGGQRYISDHFFPNEEAEAQYNCEPFYDPSRPRIDPNPSFDLCYLAFWIFRQENMKLNRSKNEFEKIIMEWCKDDKQKNIVVDKYGKMRFDGFDLYEHIAKNVHNHIPLQQLDKPFFKQFIYRGNIPNINDANIEIVDIDAIPCLV